MKAIVIGAGGPTRELLRRLSDRWDVTVLDTSAEALERVKGLRPVRALHADGTSRLVLEKAGFAGADALVAATNSDEANLEICRLARDAGVRRIVAIAADSERSADYKAIGVAVFSPDGISARRIEENLEIRQSTSHPFAKGKAEAIEFEVSPRAPVCGKQLRQLRSRNWIVGCVLRRGDLLIPHGETAIEAGDLVTVIASNAHFAEIVRAFTSGEPRFPLEFGKNVLLALEASQIRSLPEARHLVRNSRADALVLVRRDESSMRDEEASAQIKALVERADREAEGVETLHRTFAGLPLRSLSKLFGSESVGAFVTPATERWGPFKFLQARRLLSLAKRTATPVLVSRGSAPYHKILAPARRTASGRQAASAAIDLAVRGKATLTAVAAVEPLFLAGPGAAREALAAIHAIEEEASLFGLQVESVVRHGNPVRVLLEAIREADLLVIGTHEERGSWFSASIASHLIARSPVSVLLVPVKREREPA